MKPLVLLAVAFFCLMALPAMAQEITVTQEAPAIVAVQSAPVVLFNGQRLPVVRAVVSAPFRVCARVHARREARGPILAIRERPRILILRPFPWFD